ncbi:MAG: DHH family phosphoesterase [Acidobacteriota bacterium]|nr:DHH family phosphoesterase [Acidobacteriota bacterium]
MSTVESTPLQELSNAPQPCSWQPKFAPEPAALALLTVHLACPPAVAQILISRGIDTPTAADAFLHPSLAALLDAPASDPAQMLGMAPAVARILAAIRAAESILIYGDYDVDGTTATVLLKTTIERIGQALHPPIPQRVSYHVPHRIREGYGMQNAILGEAAAAGVRLVISVDTGIRAVAEAAEARTLGLDLIVTDHHLPDELSALPDCLAVINPAQPGCPYPNKFLCGAAVAFKLAQALLTAAAPFTADPAAFHTRTRDVLIPSFLKLVAIATIADSVPLSGENRIIAALGLAALANPVQPGLRSLMQFAKLPLDRAPTATEVGFRLAPRINAAGRMDIASDVVELFLTRDRDRAHALALKLDTLNTARRDSEAKALDAIDQELLTLLDGDGAYPADCIVLDHADWHRGVLGILASRVVDRTGRPALVLTHADGNAHGSGRSIPGFHLLDALTAVNTAETEGGPGLTESDVGIPDPPTTPAVSLFNRFGGHAHAVGFSLPSAVLPLLRQRMHAYATSRLNPSLLLPELDYDAEISLSDITPDLNTWIARCAPFGIGNAEPVFLTRGLKLAAPVRIIKDQHVCLQLAQSPIEPGQPAPPCIPALGWSRGPRNWLSICSCLTSGSVIDVLYRLRNNTGPYAGSHFNGLELELRDLHLCTPTPDRRIACHSDPEPAKGKHPHISFAQP